MTSTSGRAESQLRRARRGGVAWVQAREVAFAAPTALAATTMGLFDAAGTALAEPVVALGDLPAFDTAAMDGFAVAGGGPHRILGSVVAGTSDGHALRPGTAVSISTGSVVPLGTTTIVPLEEAVVTDGELVTSGEPSPGRHIRFRGEDAHRGELLAPAGTTVAPALLGLAASCGYDILRVRPVPSVDILVTGDELRDDGVSGGALVRDAYGPMLPSLVAGLGGRIGEIRRVPDRPADRLTQALLERSTSVPVVVVTGSTSVGLTDRLRPLLAARGARFVVDHVACRPGHPQLLAGLPDGRWVVGLPGNPFAGLVAALTLLGPLLAGLAGRRLPRLSAAPVTGDVRPLTHATRLVPVAWDEHRVRTLEGHGSAFLRGAALADAVAAVPPGWQPGAAVQLVTLPSGLAG